MSADTTPAQDVQDLPKIPAQQTFFNNLLKDDDIEWKSLLLESVRNNQMDPWDIELSFVASQFLKMVREYREMNFKLSGKVILAAALLLKLKSHRFVSHDINALDALIASTENDVSDDIIHDEPFNDDYRQGLLAEVAEGQPQLYPRTPQPRKRKVSVYDLIKALEQALEVNKRREMRILGSAPAVLVPTKSFDITKGLNSIYKAVASHYITSGNDNHLTFFKLIPSTKRNDKVFTFIPLLHLRNMQKVEMDQKDHFGDFTVILTNPNAQAALDEELVFITETVPKTAEEQQAQDVADQAQIDADQKLAEQTTPKKQKRKPKEAKTVTTPSDTPQPANPSSTSQ